MRATSDEHNSASKEAQVDIANNEILRAIYERRAVRKYKDIAVERAIIEKIVDAGRMDQGQML